MKMRFEEIKMDETMEVNGGSAALGIGIAVGTLVVIHTYKKYKKLFSK